MISTITALALLSTAMAGSPSRAIALAPRYTFSNNVPTDVRVGLAVWAIIVIVIGALCFIIPVIILIVVCCRRSKANKRTAAQFPAMPVQHQNAAGGYGQVYQAGGQAQAYPNPYPQQQQQQQGYPPQFQYDVHPPAGGYQGAAQGYPSRDMNASPDPLLGGGAPQYHNPSDVSLNQAPVRPAGAQW